MSGTTFQQFDASGNKFLIMLRDEVPDEPLSGFKGSGLARKWCDPALGLGADGLIVADILQDGAPRVAGNGSEASNARMRLWNSDGSEAEVSGNCLLCLAHAVARRWSRTQVDIMVETRLAGFRRCTASQTEEPDVMEGTVVLDKPRPSPRPQPEEADLVAVFTEVVGSCRVQRWDTVDVGNPHAVIMVDDPNRRAARTSRASR